MNKYQKGVNFGFADGFMPDGTPVYIQTRPGESPSPLQLQIYAQLTGVTPDVQSLYPRIMIHDWKPQNPEEAFVKIVTQRAENLGGNA